MFCLCNVNGIVLSNTETGYLTWTQDRGVCFEIVMKTTCRAQPSRGVIWYGGTTNWQIFTTLPPTLTKLATKNIQIPLQKGTRSVLRKLLGSKRPYVRLLSLSL